MKFGSRGFPNPNFQNPRAMDKNPDLEQSVRNVQMYHSNPSLIKPYFSDTFLIISKHKNNDNTNHILHIILKEAVENLELGILRSVVKLLKMIIKKKQQKMIIILWLRTLGHILDISQQMAHCRHSGRMCDLSIIFTSSLSICDRL